MHFLYWAGLSAFIGRQLQQDLKAFPKRHLEAMQAIDALTDISKNTGDGQLRPNLSRRAGDGYRLNGNSKVTLTVRFYGYMARGT